MCWLCINEEKVFADSGLRIVERKPGPGYSPILVENAGGARYWTNPAADWLFGEGADLFGSDADGEPFLIRVS